MKISDQYAAGFFDGEGSVYAAVRRHSAARPSPTIMVCISNTNLAVLEAHKERWGGSVSPRKLREGHQQQYQWVLCARMAEPFLEAIYPYLIIKRQVVEAAISFRKEMQKLARERVDYERRVKRNGHFWSSPEVRPEHKSKIDALHALIRKLNTRGAPYNARRVA